MAGEGFRVDRRTTLAWLSGAIVGGAGLLPGIARATGEDAVRPALGYGLDPELLNPTLPWPRTMSAEQLRTAAVLADLILPPTPSAPAPSACGVPDFVDEWVSAPYPDQQRDRALILPGLLWLNSESARRWGAAFPEVRAERQGRLLAEISVAPSSSDPEAMRRYGFFRAFRTVSVGAYYSLERNWAEIGYVGNKPLAAFPPPSADDLVFLNAAIAKLGL